MIYALDGMQRNRSCHRRNVQAQFLRVDTVWPYTSRGPVIYFTNTVCTIVAPDNRSSSAF